jgi:hypothetical protein
MRNLDACPVRNDNLEAVLKLIFWRRGTSDQRAAMFKTHNFPVCDYGSPGRAPLATRRPRSFESDS